MTRRPLCRTCGKPISKRVDEVSFGFPRSTRPNDRPRSREELARFVNGRVLSVVWHYKDDELGRWISSANVWDGESYVDPAFHSERCAAAFGRSMAAAFPDYATDDYRAALAALPPP